VCIDSQSVKTTEMGGPERGYDGGKKLNGRQRYLVVDTLGLLLVVLMTRPRLDDGVAAPLLLDQVHHTMFRVLSRALRISSITITLWRPGELSTTQAGVSQCRHGQPAQKV
jgi:hypothetical protein